MNDVPDLGHDLVSGVQPCEQLVDILATFLVLVTWHEALPNALLVCEKLTIIFFI